MHYRSMPFHSALYVGLAIFLSIVVALLALVALLLF
jgi:hypothetical protein